MRNKRRADETKSTPVGTKKEPMTTEGDRRGRKRYEKLEENKEREKEGRRDAIHLEELVKLTDRVTAA